MKSKTVAIEIGHGPAGAADQGTWSYGKRITEYELNKVAAFACQQKLEEWNVDSVIIDDDASLTSLGRKAEGYACFVSIHHNSYDGKVQGVETLIERTTSNQKDRELAEHIQTSLVTHGGGVSWPNRGVKEQGLAVLKGADSVGAVCCLAELYFIDSLDWTKEQFISASKARGAAVAKGIATWYFDTFKNSESKPETPQNENQKDDPNYPYQQATLPVKGTWVELVRALQGLGEAPKRVLSSAQVEQGIRNFQRKHSLVVDGFAGPKTLAAMTLALEIARGVKPTTDTGSNDKAFLMRTQKKDEFGCYVLNLRVGDETFNVVSGQPNAQNFRLPGDPKSKPGCMEPLPQCEYDIGAEEWADGVDNYNASQGAGLGAWWRSLVARISDDRNSFGFHLDANRFQDSPGSAGCVCTTTLADTKRLVAALRKFKPKVLVVDWNL